jgi:arginine repressor
MLEKKRSLDDFTNSIKSYFKISHLIDTSLSVALIQQELKRNDVKISPFKLSVILQTLGCRKIKRRNKTYYTNIEMIKNSIEKSDKENE